MWKGVMCEVGIFVYLKIQAINLALWHGQSARWGNFVTIAWSQSKINHNVSGMSLICQFNKFFLLY